MTDQENQIIFKKSLKNEASIFLLILQGKGKKCLLKK